MHFRNIEYISTASKLPLTHAPFDIGKWWLIGSSWRDNMVGTESKHSTSSSEGAKNTSATESLVKLARQQGMNTDVRRSVFVVLMSSEVSILLRCLSVTSSAIRYQMLNPGLYIYKDYIDAFERLLKLNLTEVQEREIARVILHCAGNVSTPVSPGHFICVCTP